MISCMCGSSLLLTGETTEMKDEAYRAGYRHGLTVRGDSPVIFRNYLEF